ncbi:inner-membrane translocator [Streptomyces brasiliensis]|uniref:Uncharacterized protein n=1 Tax=Streptomyces brasiliensis TaxID=1954 RepID=A0A917UPT9_9ACTN|nr:inner-membrane translocator [Streptomyces brasiliensis]GGJ73121.1 hypothetical protein GCM10010121_099650 [Streptomyces brasiliensis]
MPELAEEQSSDGNDAFAAGCLLLLVLVADVAAGLLVFIVLAVRGLSRMNAGSKHTVVSTPPADWTQVLWFGALTLAVCVTGVVLLRLGHRYIGAVQLVLCIVPASLTLGAWP